MKRINKKTNRLLQVMISISILIHMVIFMHIAGIYKSESLTYIELSMQDISKPVGRAIPRPRIRNTPPEVADVKQLVLPKLSIPNIPIDPADTYLPNDLMESIAVPAASEGAVDGVSELFARDGSSLFSRQDYYDMLRMKIERAKKYPEKARQRFIEGRVKVRFVITTDGQVSSVSIVRHSGNAGLDKAAINAVHIAAPFARPPSGLFNGPLKMEITIVFELT